MKLTPAMIRELRSMAHDGNPTDPAEWHGANALWFHARDKVIGALLRRELICDDGAHSGYMLTPAGNAALAAAA